jgi:VWFA-related protein
LSSVTITAHLRTALSARTWSAAVLVFATLLCSFALAQQQGTAKEGQGLGPGDLLFKSSVNRVVLDVVVTDSDGKPVRGLTQKDFSLAEDGQPQQILSFDVHDLNAGSDFAKLPPLPPNTFVNIPTAPEKGPLYVLLLDLVNTETSDEPYARAQLLKFMQEKPAGTRFAVFVLSDGLHLVQGFTDDQKQLTDLLDPKNPKSHIPRIFLYQRNYGQGNVSQMVSVVTFIGRFLNGLPGRKNLLWFAGNFPLTFSPTDDVRSYQDEIKGALDTLAEAQVAVYPVDVRGVVYENAHAPAGDAGAGGVTSDFRNGSSTSSAAASSTASSSAPSGAATTGSTSGGGAGHDTGDQGISLLMASYQVQDEIAKTTGGHAFHSNNGLKELLDNVVEDGANYYTLTYAPTNKNFNGSQRSIRVELAKRGYQLAYRRSYYGTTLDAPRADKNYHVVAMPESTAPRKLGDSLYANMQHGAPLAHQIYFRAQIHSEGTVGTATPEQMANLQEQPAYFRARRKDKPAKPVAPVQLQTYLVDFTVMAQSKAVGTARPAGFEIAAAAYDSEGKMLNGVVANASAPNPQPNTQGGSKGFYRAEQPIDVPVGATSIRVAVRDISTDRIGAMEVSLPLAAESQAQAASPSQSGNPGSAKPN